MRLFAALRELAGSSQVEAEGRTAGDVVDILSSRYGERFAQIAAVGPVIVNGERAALSTPLTTGDDVPLLPPVSGGSRMRTSSG